LSAFSRIALIGFGEVGQILSEDLAKAGVTDIAVWDLALASPDSAPSRALRHHAVRAATSGPDAVAGAELVISAVTADQDLAAARSVGPGLARGANFLDLNSCSPGQKLASAAAIEAAGGAYVESAVMSPIGPRRIASPMLLGGPHAADFLERARPLGFTGARVFSDKVGQAAATKLCRSVMIKGIEALLTESMLAARHYGVEQVVLDSLSDLLPLPDWNATAQYMISRSLEHGTRRAEEMREAARTVEEAHIQPLMSRAIAERQDWAAAYRPALSADLDVMLDAIIRDMGAKDRAAKNRDAR
jgi:3-hydroxyisobutyrate dehydrogenase-like beta-hydroxyacid dehydrogenase